LKADKWPYGLIVLDPLYKVLGGRQENSPEQMAELMSHLEGLTLTRKAAIVYPSHYSKGNQSEKAHIDRISGSGVLARDPDAICTLTRHQEDFCYSVEFSLRNLRPLTPFVVRWNYPLFEVVEDADPANLKTGRTRKYDDEAVLHPLHKGPLTYSDWFKALEGTTGMSQRTFDGYLGRLKRQHAVIQSATNGTYYIPRGSARGSAPDPDSE
jgi:hypothetical protein